MSRANFVQVKLAAGVAAAANTLSVQAIGAAFNLPPADGGLLTITDSLGGPEAHEIIRYTARSGSGPYTLSGVTRGLEGTTPRAWSAGAYVVQCLTAGEFDAKQDLIPAGAAGQFYGGDKSWQDLAAAVRLVLLTGLGAGTNTPISAADGLLVGLAKLQAQISARAPLASPALSGIPTAPTPALGTNTDQIATMAALQAAISALIGSSPAALDTLKELATALGNDPNFATTMLNALAGKLGASDTAVAAQRLAVARLINGVSFDGTQNVTVYEPRGAWTQCALYSGFANVSGLPLRYQIIGKHALVIGSVSRAAALTFNELIAGVPVPAVTGTGVVYCIADSYDWKAYPVSINADGGLRCGLLASQAGPTLQILLHYPIS